MRKENEGHVSKGFIWFTRRVVDHLVRVYDVVTIHYVAGQKEKLNEAKRRVA